MKCARTIESKGVSLFVSTLLSADAARKGDRTTLLSEILRDIRIARRERKTCLPRCNCNFMQMGKGDTRA